MSNLSDFIGGDVSVTAECEKLVNIDVFDKTKYLFGNQDDIQLIADTNFQKWTQLTSGIANYSHTAIVYNDKMIVFGGYNGSDRLNTTYEYDITNDTWTQLSSGAIAMSNSVSVIYNGKMIVFGGYNGSEVNNDTWEYDITNDAWTQLSSGATARYLSSAILHNDKMIIFGGYDKNSNLNDTWEYDITNDTWTQLSSSGVDGFYHHTAIVYNDEMIVFGGYNGSVLSDTFGYNISNEYKYQNFLDNFKKVIPYDGDLL